MNHIKVEDKLSVNKFDIDEDCHIRLDDKQCRECEDHPCVFICPSECFKWAEDHITFSFEGCLECGSCRVICDTGVLDWTLPRGGLGICYQYG